MSSDHKKELFDALNRIIAPLAQLCIRQKITHSEIEERIRLAFVEAAQSNLLNPDTEMTNTRIGVLTGFNRKEVARLKAILAVEGTGLVELPPSPAQIIVNGWLNDKEFRDTKNKPRVLPISNKKGDVEHGSFKALVDRYGSDLRYFGIMQELLNSQVIKSVDNDKVALVNHAFIPHKDEIKTIEHLAKSVSDQFNTALFNLEQDDVTEKKYQRQVSYSQIDGRFAGELKLFIEENAQELVDVLAVELHKKKKLSNRRTKANKKTIGFGLYYIEKDLGDDQ